VRLSPALALALLLAATACSGASGSGAVDRGGALHARVEPVFDTPREYRTIGALPCEEGASLVYVVSQEGDLYSFRPDAGEFSRIGALHCPTRGYATPHSMAVDRSATAWVNYTDGSLYRVSTKDARCARTDFEPGQHGFGRFGMAFASTGDDLSRESLFVWGSYDYGDDGRGLATIDTHTLRLQPVGDANDRLHFLEAELTGTGDGRLYGFFATGRAATLAGIDVKTGAARDPRPLPGVRTGSAWAFSFWGGDFYFFWAPGGASSRVSRLSGSDGSVNEVLHDVGFRIVGAGVSTCAPTETKAVSSRE
jgi:hypothetical protein